MKDAQITLENQLEKQRALTQLLENRGWLTLQKILQQQVDALQNEILFTPCSNLDSTIAQEYKKGQLEGRLALAELVMTELDVCASQIRHLKEIENANDNSGSPEPTPSGGSAP